jgi:hypothetical protein
MQSQEYPVDDLTTDIPAEPSELESDTAETTPPASPSSSEITNEGQESGPIPEAIAWQEDEPALEPPSESSPHQATDDRRAASPPKADIGHAGPIAGTAPEATPLEPQPVNNPPSADIIPAPPTILSDRGLPSAAGSSTKTISKQGIEEAVNAPVPDRSQPARPLETP